jgi:hypothetical protein
MLDARIIEVEGEDAGIVVGDEHGFRFFAAIRAYDPLDGACFRSSGEAQKAVTRFASDRGLRRSRVDKQRCAELTTGEGSAIDRGRVPPAFLDRRTNCR